MKWKRLFSGLTPSPAELVLALRLRRETTLTVREIAQRLRLGSRKSLNNKLYLARKANQGRKEGPRR